MIGITATLSLHAVVNYQHSIACTFCPQPAEAERCVGRYNPGSTLCSAIRLPPSPIVSCYSQLSRAFVPVTACTAGSALGAGSRKWQERPLTRFIVSVKHGLNGKLLAVKYIHRLHSWTAACARQWKPEVAGAAAAKRHCFRQARIACSTPISFTGCRGLRGVALGGGGKAGGRSSAAAAETKNLEQAFQPAAKRRAARGSQSTLTTPSTARTVVREQPAGAAAEGQ